MSTSILKLFNRQAAVHVDDLDRDPYRVSTVNLELFNCPKLMTSISSPTGTIMADNSLSNATFSLFNDKVPFSTLLSCLFTLQTIPDYLYYYYMVVYCIVEI